MSRPARIEPPQEPLQQPCRPPCRSRFLPWEERLPPAERPIAELIESVRRAEHEHGETAIRLDELQAELDELRELLPYRPPLPLWRRLVLACCKRMSQGARR